MEFAAAAGAGDQRLDEIRLAASEALTNVVLHAYQSESPGRLEVVAAVTGHELCVLIADQGSGVRPRTDSPGLGLGLGLIASLSDGMEVVTRSCGGTELRMRFSLRSSDLPPISLVDPIAPRALQHGARRLRARASRPDPEEFAQQGKSR